VTWSPSIGLLGYGAIAAEHARMLSALGCRLTSVMGPDLDSAREFAAAHGIARTTDDLAEAVGAADVDAIVVASPNALHADQAVAALDAGKHVLVEVPLAMSAADAERVAAAAERSGRHAMVAHTQRFWGPMRDLRAVLGDGALPVRHVVARNAIRRRENIGWTGRRRSWVDSALWHHGSHLVDAALWLLDGDVESVSAEAGQRDAANGSPLDVAIAIRTSGGGLATIALSYNSLLPVSDMLVIGEDDAFRIDGARIESASGALTGSGDPVAMQEDAIRAQDAAFVRALRGDEAARPTPADVLPVYRALQEASDRLTP
jgi:2-hydroxy-4-carboxymuconate semialdehyde hemiacetal dehydrogenase